MGYSSRTPRGEVASVAAAQLRNIVSAAGYELVAVPVRGCLHLKSAATWLGGNTLLINREWTDAAVFAGFRLIDVDPAEPFAGNALRVRETLIHAGECPRTRKRLEAAGFRVRPVPASELAKAEGGVTCCSLIL